MMRCVAVRRLGYRAEAPLCEVRFGTLDSLDSTLVVPAHGHQIDERVAKPRPDRPLVVGAISLAWTTAMSPDVLRIMRRERPKSDRGAH